MNNKLTTRPAVEREEHDDAFQIGQWCLYRDKNDGELLACIEDIGSNYIGLDFVENKYTTRVHFNKVEKTCKFISDEEALAIISERQKHYTQKTEMLMLQVSKLVARLGVAKREEIAGSSMEEINQLAVNVASKSHINQYKKDLVKAKDVELPELFKQIEESNHNLAQWMRAMLLPVSAQAALLKGVISKINDRIFNVELYAGLVEECELIQDGEPADIAEPIHIFQRRHYMDEECLLDYRAGGMEFKDVGKFDRWFLKKKNLNRILPYKRSIVAFRVRRNDKERHFETLHDFIRFLFSGEREWDKTTFLYIRNGERVYRLTTEIDFHEQLFPEANKYDFNQPMYFRGSEIITEGEYVEMRRTYARELKEYKRKRKIYKEEDWMEHNCYFGPHREHTFYQPFTPETTEYDDIAEQIQDNINHHNRIVIVLQGLLDRSPVFHPHPPWRIGNEDGFKTAIKLIYDDSRGMTHGDPPDFEEYRKKLNATLTNGSMTIGQQEFWIQKETEKQNKKAERRGRYGYGLRRYIPYGNPGPGLGARVVRFHKKTKECSYEWQRETWRYDRATGEYEKAKCTLKVPAEKLLNLDAYKKDDYKQFYEDPRTRAQYLKWAPLLLGAEDFLAGKTQEQDSTMDF